MARIFGFGYGVILVSTIWTICVLLCLSFSRRKGFQSGFVYLVIAAVINVILYIWPKEPCDPLPIDSLTKEQEIDHLGIPRIIFALVLLFLAIYATIRCVAMNLFTAIRTKRIQEKVT